MKDPQLALLDGVPKLINTVHIKLTKAQDRTIREMVHTLLRDGSNCWGTADGWASLPLPITTDLCTRNSVRQALVAAGLVERIPRGSLPAAWIDGSARLPLRITGAGFAYVLQSGAAGGAA